MRVQRTKTILFLCLFLFLFSKKSIAGEWVQTGHSWEYREDGVKVTNRWIEDNGQWFYFKEDGTMAKSEWITQSGMFYYMMEDGAMAQSQWIEIKGKWYYLGKTGAMARNQSIDGYFLSADGICRKQETRRSACKSGRIDDAGYLVNGEWAKRSNESDEEDADEEDRGYEYTEDEYTGEEDMDEECGEPCEVTTPDTGYEYGWLKRVNKTSFDYVRYAEDYPELYALYGYDKEKLFQHYTDSGEKEGRIAHTLFFQPERQDMTFIGYNGENMDLERYRRENPDVMQANPKLSPYNWGEGRAREHYWAIGRLEGRRVYATDNDSDQTRAQRMAYDIAKRITKDSMTDREKIKAVHDWIIKNVKYSNRSYNCGTLSGAMLEHKAVCEGYAETFDFFMYILGIEHELVIGKTGRLHAWNRVLLDGNWLYVDCTWDDPIGGPKDTIRRKYFLCTRKEMDKDHKMLKVEKRY